MRTFSTIDIKLRYSFVMILSAVLIIAVLSGSMAVAMESEQPTPPVAFEFSDFGTYPSSDMTCLRLTTFNAQDEQQATFSSYSRSDDVLLFHDLAISPPVYDFYDNKLFRIRFHIAEDSGGDPDESLSRLSAILEDYYSMIFAGEDTRTNDRNDSSHKLIFTSNDDIVAEITWKKYGACWGAPMIKIQKKDLINKLNKAMNPDYISKVY